MNKKRKILIIASVALVLASVTGGLLVYKDNVAKAQAIASSTQLEEAKLQLSEVAIQSNLAAQVAKDS